MSNWNASDNGLNGIRESLYRIAGYLERKEERETAIKDAPVERDLENTHSTREPLIKDEKIRKAVRAWAEADGADEKIYLTIDDNGSRFDNKYGGYIEFAFIINMEERLYTIEELCGEEE